MHLLAPERPSCRSQHLVRPCMVLTIILCFFVQSVRSQALDEQRLSANFREATRTEILEDISRRFSLPFYLPPAGLPPERISLTFADTPLPAALDRVLDGTVYGFLIYRSYLIVIAEQEKLAQSYSPVFFKALEEKLNLDQAAPDDTPVVFEIGRIDNINPTGRATLSGQILDAATLEPIIGATVYFPQLSKGTGTDADGRFSLILPVGKQEMLISYLGYNTRNTAVNVFNDGEINTTLESVSIAIKEIVVEAEAADANVSSAAIGVTRLQVEAIRKLPSFLGEVDVIKSLLQQPGVSTVGEGANGFNVRGGNVDQNLVLMDEQFVFNTSHALGFFSAFNPDVVSGVTLYKGHMPAQYGGRLASVLDVNMKDGNLTKFRMKGGIGLVASRISAEGPVVKNKSSFLAGFRTTYANWVLQLSRVPEVRNSSADFYDVNLRYTHRFNENNTLIFSVFSAGDKNVFNDEFGFDYNTQSGQIIYKKIINPRLISTLSATVSEYEATGRELQDSVTSAQLYTRYRYLKVKELLTYSPDNDLKITAGLSSVFYKIRPGEREPYGRLSTVIPQILEDEQALESAAFANAEYTLSPRWSASAGLRLVLYQYLGPRTYFNYADPEAPSAQEISGQTVAGAGKLIQGYASLEPRAALRYLLDANTSLKFGYSRTAQFINQLANLTSPTPVSIWQLSTSYIEPQRAHSFSLGIFKNLDDNRWETSLEAYYRYIDHLNDYKDFAELSANPAIEAELLPGIGKAYGLEASLKKNGGDLNGWVSYTYSRTLQQVNGVNDGDWYPAHFDKPHDLTVVTNWQLTGRINLALNFNYSTGRPITAPTGRYTAAGQYSVLEYSARNQVRIPDYHRLDASFTVDRGYRKTQLIKSNWTITVYNLYGRKNAYSVFFEPTQSQVPRTVRLAVLGSAFLSLTLNFFFQ